MTRTQESSVPLAADAQAITQSLPILPQLPCTYDQRHEMIAVAAYFRAEKRGFAVGSELDDWLAAEDEIDHSSC